MERRSWYTVSVCAIGIISLAYIIFVLSMEAKENLLTDWIITDTLLYFLMEPISGKTIVLNILAIIGSLIIASALTNGILSILKIIFGTVGTEARWHKYVLAPFNCLMAMFSCEILVWLESILKITDINKAITDFMNGDSGISLLQIFVIALIIYSVFWLFRVIVPIAWGMILYFLKYGILPILFGFGFVLLYNLLFGKFSVMTTDTVFVVVFLLFFFFICANVEDRFPLLSNLQTNNYNRLILSLLCYIKGLLWFTVIGGVLFNGFIDFLIELITGGEINNHQQGKRLQFEEFRDCFAFSKLPDRFRTSLFMGGIKILPFLILIGMLMLNQILSLLFLPTESVYMYASELVISLLLSFYLRAKFPPEILCKDNGSLKSRIRECKSKKALGNTFFLIGWAVLIAVATPIYGWVFPIYKRERYRKFAY